MTDYDEGDWRVAVYTSSPFDGTTVAVLSVISPSGVTTTPAVTPSGGGATHTAAGYELTAAGEWVERWVITGTGKGKQRDILLVAPDPTALPTGLRVYATTTDYANETLAAPPTGIRRMLRVASKIVDEMLFTAVYDVDINGLPTDADHIIAFRNATCLQAEFASTAADKNMVGAARPAGFSLGKLSVQRAAGTQQPGGLGPRGEWSPRAWSTLQVAGLTGHEARG